MPSMAAPMAAAPRSHSENGGGVVERRRCLDVRVRGQRLARPLQRAVHRGQRQLEELGGERRRV